MTVSERTLSSPELVEGRIEAVVEERCLQEPSFDYADAEFRYAPSELLNHQHRLRSGTGE